MSKKERTSAELAPSGTPKWVAIAKDLSTTATAISAAAGIAFSSFTYVSTQWKKNDEIRRSQLSTFSTYGQYLTRYQRDIQPALGNIMADSVRQRIDTEMRVNKRTTCKSELNKNITKTGFQAFASKKFTDVREVHNFYESIAYGLKKDQLDFETIFELITLPAYWKIQDPGSDWYKKNDALSQPDADKTKTFLYPDFSVLLPWRDCLGPNFFGLSQPLSDFSDNVDRLGYNYLFARMKYLYRRSCKNGEPLNDKDSSSPSFIGPSSGNWSMAVLSNACHKLQKRIKIMARAEGRPKTWMKLYRNNANDIDPEWEIDGHSFQWPFKE